jgi:RimJ/RimL family protein N-acetyltransferase/spore coat polysaccharide biosynthesis predicted glycosyltransferase SpsG
VTPLLVCRAAPGPGLGHLVRSAALAQAWLDAGGRSLLSVSRAVPPATELVDDVELVLEADDDWLDRTVERRPTWVLVDDPSVGPDAIALLRASGSSVLVLDDHGAHGDRGANLLLDQNLGAREGGVRYALLRRPFRQPIGGGRRDRVAVLLGGGPSGPTLGFAAEVVEKLAAEGVSVDVVAGGGALALSGAGVRAHPYVAEPSGLLARVAVAVSTSGSSAWELCRMGVAPVLVAVADDQAPVGAALAAAGAARYVGRLESVDPAVVAAEALALLDDAPGRDRMRAAGAALVDGLGAVRVTNRLRADSVSLRPVVAGDAGLLFGWANDPGTRAASLSTEPIPWDDHVAWLERRLARPEAPTLVAQVGGEPVGVVRFDPLDDRSAEISITLDPAHRGRRLAAPVIVAGCRAAFAGDPALDRIDARVRTGNTRSVGAFLAADFDPIGEHEEHGVRWFGLSREGRWR